MKNLREYKLLQEMKRLVNNMEKGLNKLISESRAGLMTLKRIKRLNLKKW